MFKKKCKVRRWEVDWLGGVNILIELWRKKYVLNVSIDHNQENSDISKLQKKIYKKYLKNIVENQKKIEEAVSKYFNTTEIDILISKFIPYELQINIKGECALIAKNIEDKDIHDVLPELAVVIYPKMLILPREAY